MMTRRIFQTDKARFLCVVTLAALVTVAFWPGVHGFWGRDDFATLALLRMIGSPWPLFVHDHFPVPGSVFRPLGFASLWLCEKLFGSDYAANASVDLALHAAVSVALFGLMLRAGLSRLVALPSTLLFALHPAVIGTALWWSARFDLLATLFILLAVHAAYIYRDKREGWALACALVAALAAMLSKEIGLIAVAVQLLLWLRWAYSDPKYRARALLAITLSCSCALAFLVWRWLVLGTLSSGVTGVVPMGSAIGRGLIAWVQQAPGYLTFWARTDFPERIALGLALLIASVAMLIAVARRKPRFEWGNSADLVLCGSCLLLVPALLQAPIAAFAMHLSLDYSVIEAAMQSRLYYLGIVGLVMIIAAVLNVFWKASGLKLQGAFFFSLLLASLALGTTSRDIAQRFAQRSVDISGVARKAVAAISRIQMPLSGCQVMFVGVEPPPEWSIYVSMDSIIKALVPDLDRVKHCWFHDNYGTPMNLQAAPASPSDALPYEPLLIDSRPVPWRTIGDVVIAFVRLPEHVDPEKLVGMVFLRNSHGRFEVSTNDVKSGRQTPGLK